MSKSSKIVVSGDSFTANNHYPEEDFINVGFSIQELKYALPKYTSWPLLLQEKLKTHVINKARSGMGNYYICKSATNAIVENYGEVKLCIVALSSWNRMETTKWDSIPAIKLFDYEKNKFIVSDYDLTTIMNNTLRSIYELQLICNHLNIPLVFFNMIMPIPNLRNYLGESKPIEIHKNVFKFIVENPYFSLIDSKYAIGWPFFDLIGGYNFLQRYILSDKNKYCVGPMQKLIERNTPEFKYYYDHHPNQEGHKLIFEKVIENLEKFKLI